MQLEISHIITLLSSEKHFHSSKLGARGTFFDPQILLALTRVSSVYPDLSRAARFALGLPLSGLFEGLERPSILIRPQRDRDSTSFTLGFSLVQAILQFALSTD